MLANQKNNRKVSAAHYKAQTLHHDKKKHSLHDENFQKSDNTFNKKKKKKL